MCQRIKCRPEDCEIRFAGYCILRPSSKRSYTPRQLPRRSFAAAPSLGFPNPWSPHSGSWIGSPVPSSINGSGYLPGASSKAMHTAIAYSPSWLILRSASWRSSSSISSRLQMDPLSLACRQTSGDVPDSDPSPETGAPVGIAWFEAASRRPLALAVSKSNLTILLGGSISNKGLTVFPIAFVCPIGGESMEMSSRNRLRFE